jgi:hypothetical protein
MEKKALLTTQFKVKCENCGKMSHKTADYKSRHEQQQRFETLRIK